MIPFVTERWAILASLIVPIAVTIALIAKHSEPFIDDSFYYLRIAQFIAAGKGSTFDGINLTNGYHPLWLFMLVPVFWLTSSPETGRLLATVVQGGIFALGVYIFYRTARLLVGRIAAAIAASLWVLLTYSQSLSGTEFSVHALSVMVLAFVYLRWFTQGPAQASSRYLTLGLLSGVAILARLETMLLAVILGLFLLRMEWRDGLWGKWISHLLAFGLPVLLVCVAYLGANIIIFGHALPVSGVVKGSWSTYFLSQDATYRAQGWLAAKIYLASLPVRALIQARLISAHLYPLYMTVGTFGAASLWLTSALLPRSSPWRDWLHKIVRPLRPFLLYSVLSYLGYVIFYQGWLVYSNPWYYMIQPWITSLMMAAVLERFVIPLSAVTPTASLQKWLRRASLLITLGIALGIPSYTVRAIWQSSAESLSPFPSIEFYQGAQWIRGNLPPNAILGSWNAGMISYYSGHQVVNLDGLVNSWDFYENGQYDLCGYWRQENITYIADYFEGSRALSAKPSDSTYASCANELELVWMSTMEDANGQIRVYRIRWADP